jgi:uncharacterized membrane protein YkoI
VVYALVLVLAADPDYEKLLKQAKLTLVEAIGKADGGTVVAAALEDDNGDVVFAIHVAKGNKTKEVILDVTEGKVVESNEDGGEDDSKAVAAAKISIKQAIEKALKKVPGKAVTADLDMAEDGKPDYEIGIFANGKVTKVTVNAVTGEVIEK